MKNSKISSFIDHTLLNPEATARDIEILCREAIQYGFPAVCVNPYYVSRAFNILQREGVKVVSVAGFPLGATYKEVKINEIKKAVGEGAEEIDMVMNIGAFKNKDYQWVVEEIEEAAETSEPALLKVIVETALLDWEEKKRVCELIKKSKASYIKTSTGLIPGGGARSEDVKLFQEILKGKKKIKASGGIRDLVYARKLLSNGADRIGSSSGIDIVLEELEE